MKIKSGVKGFTLLELLVVVLIIAILAAIALPKYQLAVDKARYAKMIDFTRAISEASIRTTMTKEDPSFNDLDIDIPKNCIKTDNYIISCDNGIWGCLINNATSKYYRCSDLSINATLLYVFNPSKMTVTKYCYAHSLDNNDRANRLCQAITRKKIPFNDKIGLFNGSYISVNGYHF